MSQSPLGLWATSTTRVIQFSSTGEIKSRFEAESIELVIEDGSAQDILHNPDIVLPSVLLNDFESLENKEFLELIEPGCFDEEYGDGDSDSDSEISSEEHTGAEWVAAKIKAVASDCNEFESCLLDAVLKPDEIDISFNNVCVDPSIVSSLRALTSLTAIKPEAFTYGVLAKEKILGVLLHGPPGTGKTLLAKAVAKDAKAVFLPVSGADFLSKWVGEDEKLVRAVFSLARKLDPCIIFIDEADSVFRQRTSDDSEYKRNVISQFLLEWDGIKTSGKGTFVMAATNRLEDIDAAVLRRLPRRIFVGPPSAEYRRAILKAHLMDEKLDPDLDLEKLAQLTVSCTGSDLKSLCVAAAMAAVYEQVSDVFLGSDPAGKQRKKSRRKRALRRTLHLRHFEQALREFRPNSGHDQQAQQPKPRDRPSGMDPATLAKFKTFGNMYAGKE
ncbi:P-loop containing nucleoside triphosphate hydrolase protein [Hyaloscypha finlandica]|nr:P-loop containing nucleoside triphosphate hydrolase protein [Hyaloscypha finlandica]